MDYDIFFRFLLALIFVLGLLGLLAWAARRFGLGGRVAMRPGRRRRMMVVEATAVDAKRRLVLVRRDDVEHLVLLGPTNDLVIEQGIAVPADDLETDRRGGGTPRDFGSELKARLGLGTAAETAVAAPQGAPQPPKPALPAKRRLSKSKLSQLKPERLRFGKQPSSK